MGPVSGRRRRLALLLVLDRPLPGEVVAAPRVEAGHPHGHAAVVRGLVERDVGDQRLAGVRGHHAVQQDGGIGGLGPDHAPGVQQRPEALVARHPAGQPVELRVRGRREVPLDAERPEERRGAPEVQAEGPAGAVRGRCGHVRAEVLRRQQLGGPALDLLPGQRVGHVGGPDPLDALEDAEVDPSAAGGARLPHHVRVGGAQLVEQPVERSSVLVDGCRAAPPSAPGLQELAVVVPLDVADRVRREHGAHVVEHVVVDLRPGQVEHQLVAVQDRHPVAGGQDPVGMRAVEVGVRVDHLGLEPQPEVHAELAHPVDDRVEPVRPDGGVDPPVPEPGGVVTAPVEPPVVEDEALDADPRRPVGDAAQPVQVVVEPDRLPDVEHDRGGRRVGGQGPLVGVPGRGEAVQPVVGGREQHPRRPVALAGAQHHLTGLEQLPAAEGGSAGGVPLDAQHRVAAPGDVHGEDPPRGRGEVRGAEDRHRRRPEPRAAFAALTQPEPVGDRVPLRGALTLVPAGEVQHLGEVVAAGQHHLEPFEGVVPRSGVGERMTPSQRAARQRLELGEELQTGLGVRGADGERRRRRRHVPGSEPGRPGAPRRQVAAVGGEAVTAEVGPGEPLVAVLPQQRHTRAAREQRQTAGVRLPSVDQSRPEHGGQCVAAGVELDAGLRAVDGPGWKEHAEASSVRWVVGAPSVEAQGEGGTTSAVPPSLSCRRQPLTAPAVMPRTK